MQVFYAIFLYSEHKNPIFCQKSHRKPPITHNNRIMKCVKCGKTITPDVARRCHSCGSDYCDECAAKAILCDCRGELGYYS